MLCAFYAAASALSLCSTPAAAASAADKSPVRLMGDLDRDYAVSAGDAQAALNLYVEALANKQTADADSTTGTADINMDGRLTVEDAQYILEYYCETLTGGAPLWADIRKISYEDKTDLAAYFRTNADGDLLLDAEGQPIPLLADDDRPFTLLGMYIEIGCVSGKAGETVTVPVYIAGLPALAGFQMEIVNDAGLHLKAFKSDLEKDYPNLEPVWNCNFSEAYDPDDRCGRIVAAQAYNAAFKDGYTLCELQYEIPADAESGKFYGIEVNPEFTMFLTEQCEAYSYTRLSGAIRVE